MLREDGTPPSCSSLPVHQQKTEQQLFEGGHKQWSRETVGELGGGGEGKVINQKSVFTSLWESSPYALFHEQLRSCGEEGLLAQRALGAVPFGLRQSGRGEAGGGY